MEEDADIGLFILPANLVKTALLASLHCFVVTAVGNLCLQIPVGRDHCHMSLALCLGLSLLTHIPSSPEALLV